MMIGKKREDGWDENDNKINQSITYIIPHKNSLIKIVHWLISDLKREMKFIILGGIVEWAGDIRANHLQTMEKREVTNITIVEANDIKNPVTQWMTRVFRFHQKLSIQDCRLV